MKKANLVLCHSHASRCLYIRGYKFPLCARCTGIYLGLLSGLLIELFFGLFPMKYLILYAVLIIPTTIDGITQLILERESTNYLRIVTGYPAGIGIILFLRTISQI